MKTIKTILLVGAMLLVFTVGRARAVGSVGEVGGVVFTVNSVHQVGPLIFATVTVFGPTGEQTVGVVIY